MSILKETTVVEINDGGVEKLGSVILHTTVNIFPTRNIQALVTEPLRICMSLRFSRRASG